MIEQDLARPDVVPVVLSQSLGARTQPDTLDRGSSKEPAALGVDVDVAAQFLVGRGPRLAARGTGRRLERSAKGGLLIQQHLGRRLGDKKEHHVGRLVADLKTKTAFDGLDK